MADRPQIPNWNVINLNKPDEYSSEFIVDGVKYANVTDVSTGQRWLYAVGPLGTRTLISSTSPDGTITKGPGYDSVSNQYENIDYQNKQQSIYIIERVSTTAEKESIGKTSEYKSVFGNKGSTGGSGSTSASSSNTYVPDMSNPIVPIGSSKRYPKNMDARQDNIVFTAVEIEPRTGSLDDLGGINNTTTNLNDTFSAFTIQDPIYRQIAGSIVMSIQSPIQDQNGVDWTQDSITAIDALMYNAATALIGGSEGNGTSPIDKIGQQVKEAASSNVGKIQRYFAGQAAGLNNIVSRTDGVVLNPNLELIFQGPQLRPFSFTFKMSARDDGEAKDIKTIIKYFKRHMAVRKEGGLFLKAPHVFTIQYKKGTIEHPSIGIISPDITKKACALTNITVDYTPLGSYMTYNDAEGTMVSYTMALQFQEIQPIYAEDYENSHPIGY